jgi:hypothetical protein
MKRIILAALVGVLLAPSTAEAVSKNGNELFSDCSAENATYSNGICMGYIVGVGDAVLDLQFLGLIDARFSPICVPRKSGVTVGQMVDIVKKYLTDHPEFRHQGGGALVVQALRQAFPCKK